MLSLFALICQPERVPPTVGETRVSPDWSQYITLTLLTSVPPFANQVYLTEWAWILAERGELPELIDERLHGDLEKHAKAIDTMTRVSTHNLIPTSPNHWRNRALVTV